jgi:hypothetical protein
MKYKDLLVSVGFVLLLSAGVAFGLKNYVDFLNSFVFFVSIQGIYWFYKFKNEERPVDDNSSEIITELQIENAEQKIVLEEYENIFDSQLSKVPCVCGENVFEGIFSPTLENILECEKCNNKYRITLNYDTVLISEPLEINNNELFEQLKTKAESRNESKEMV